jgi:hypothetical protein
MGVVLVAACGKGDQREDCTTEVSEPVTEETTWGDVCPTVTVLASIDIRAPLTVAKATTVKMEQGVLLDVEEGGSLTAVGEMDSPIVFEGTSAKKGWWAGIAIETLLDANEMEWVVIRDAGKKGFKTHPWTLTIAGESTSPGSLRMENVTIERSSGLGLVIRSGGELRDAARVTFRDIDDVPIELGFPAVESLNNTFAFENLDKAYVHVTEGSISTEHDWGRLQVPYRLSRNLTIGEDAGLYVGAGATLQFEQDAILESGTGFLAFQGTPEDPVTLTGVEELPGYWDGIVFESASANNVLEHSVVEYAGSAGYKGHEAAVVVAGDSTMRGHATIRETEFRDINGHGILIFSGGDAEMMNNTFENIDGENVEDRNVSDQ